MTLSCPVDLDTQMLRSEVSKIYSRVAADPDMDFHFHRGPAYAVEFLGYDPPSWSLCRWNARLRLRE